MRSYDEYRRIVEDALPDALPEPKGQSARVLEAARYSLLAGGKRLRPVLVLAACEYAGGDIQNALSAAMAVECIHTYSLIHDDLPAMDDDDLRRGMPSCHKQFDEATAILAGDGLNTHAFLLLSIGLSQDPENAHRHLAALHHIAVAAGFLGMVAGQAADMRSSAAAVTKDDLAFIHANKTAALIRASVSAGLHIGGEESHKVLQDFLLYGERIGMAFQARDDVLDATSTAEQLGKTPGKDEDAHKASSVALLGLNSARERVRALSESACDALRPYGEQAAFFIKLANDLSIRRE